MQFGVKKGIIVVTFGRKKGHNSCYFNDKQVKTYKHEKTNCPSPIDAR